MAIPLRDEEKKQQSAEGKTNREICEDKTVEEMDVAVSEVA